MEDRAKRMAKGGLSVNDYNLFDTTAAAGTLVTWNTCAQIDILEKVLRGSSGPTKRAPSRSYLCWASGHILLRPNKPAKAGTTFGMLLGLDRLSNLVQG